MVRDLKEKLRTYKTSHKLRNLVAATTIAIGTGAGLIYFGVKYHRGIGEGASNAWNNTQSYARGVGQDVENTFSSVFKQTPEKFFQEVKDLEESLTKMIQDYGSEIQRGDYDKEIDELGLQRFVNLSDKLEQSLSPEAKAKLLREKDHLSSFQEYLEEAGRSLSREEFGKVLGSTESLLRQYYDTPTKLAMSIDAFMETLPYLNMQGVEAVRLEMNRHLPEKSMYALDLKELGEATKPIRLEAAQSLTDSLFNSSPGAGMEAVTYGVNKIPSEERAGFTQRLLNGLEPADRERIQSSLCAENAGNYTPGEQGALPTRQEQQFADPGQDPLQQYKALINIPQ